MKVLTPPVALAALAVALVGCASTNPGAAAPSPSRSTQDRPSAGASTPPTTGPRPTGTSSSSAGRRVLVTIGAERLEITLDDSPASRDLISQLPVTLPMEDHGSVEKTGRLPRPLSLAGQPSGADPDPADVGYYAPGHDLVLYYGDQSSYPGIVVLGRMDASAARRIGEMSGTVTATVSVSPSSP